MPFTINHHHYYHFDNEGEILKQLSLIFKNQQNMTSELEILTAAVEKNGSVIESAVTLLNGLKAQLDKAGTDPVALKALSDQLGTETASLAAAVVANTIPAPVVVPAPTV